MVSSSQLSYKHTMSAMPSNAQTQRIQFKSPGTPAIRMRSGFELFQPRAITCLCKPEELFPPTSIKQVIYSHITISLLLWLTKILIDDAPRYVRGNRALLGINCMNIVIYLLTKVYFMARNRYREKKWAAMSESERLDYLATTTDEGNKRLDFRFQH